MPIATVLAHDDQHGRAQMPTPRLRRYDGPAILSYGFRPFFLLGSIYSGWCGCQSFAASWSSLPHWRRGTGTSTKCCTATCRP